jgi:hypothetical protein
MAAKEVLSCLSTRLFDGAIDAAINIKPSVGIRARQIFQ